MTHSCIRPGCGKPYESEDVEAYYCDECVAAKKAIAAEIDAKFAHVDKEVPLTPLQQYDQAPKIRGFARG